MVVECRGGGWINAQPFILGLDIRRDARLDFRVDPGLHDVVLRLGVPHQQHLHPDVARNSRPDFLANVLPFLWNAGVASVLKFFVVQGWGRV